MKTNYFKFKKTKINGVQLHKAKSLKKKEIKIINEVLSSERIKYDDFFDKISPYIKKYKEKSFSTYEMTIEEINNVIFPNSVDIDSRFSIISDIEQIKLPEGL